MYDQSLISSIKSIGDLRNKPGYYQSLVDLFASEVERSFSGALASSAAIASRDDCWRIVHKLKGSAASIGAVGVADSCQALLSRWGTVGSSCDEPLDLRNESSDLASLKVLCHRAIQEMRRF